MGEGAAVSGAGAEMQLIMEWGMTREEARSATRTHPADLCIILRSPDDGNIRMGVLFIDSTITNAFGDDGIATEVANAMETEPEVVELAKAIARAMAPLRLAAPKITITQ
jgi:hypothetical protein